MSIKKVFKKNELLSFRNYYLFKDNLNSGCFTGNDSCSNMDIFNETLSQNQSLISAQRYTMTSVSGQCGYMVGDKRSFESNVNMTIEICDIICNSNQFDYAALST